MTNSADPNPSSSKERLSPLNLRPGTAEAARLDVGAFGRIVEALEAPLVGYARKRLRDSDEADDIVANAFTTLYVRPPELEDELHMRRWLYVVVGRACARFNRQHQRNTSLSVLEANGFQLPAPVDLSPLKSDREGDLSKLDIALSTLPAVGQDALLLRSSNMPYAEIAEIIGKTPNATWAVVHRAKNKVRQYYAQDQVLPDLLPGRWPDRRAMPQEKIAQELGVTSYWLNQVGMSLTDYRKWLVSNGKLDPDLMKGDKDKVSFWDDSNRGSNYGELYRQLGYSLPLLHADLIAAALEINDGNRKEVMSALARQFPDLTENSIRRAIDGGLYFMMGFGGLQRKNNQHMNWSRYQDRLMLSDLKEKHGDEWSMLTPRESAFVQRFYLDGNWRKNDQGKIAQEYDVNGSTVSRNLTRVSGDVRKFYGVALTVN